MPAYIPFDPAQPDGASDNGTNYNTDHLNNQAALRDHIVEGFFKGYAFSQANGTGSAERPQYVYFTKGAHIIRYTLTWTDTGGGAYQVTSMVIDRSLDTGSNWDAIETITFTYDGSGNLTSTTTGGGGWLAKVMQLWGKCTKAIADLSAHVAGTGTGVHGLGSMSTQAASAVAITGGTANDMALGGTTPDDVDATRVRETFHDYGSIGAGATVTLELDKYAHFACTPHATTSNTMVIAVSGNPASGKSQTWMLEIINGQRSADAKITWPASFKWIGGSGTRPPDNTLELAGRNLFAITTRDGGSRHEIQHLGKGG